MSNLMQCPKCKAYYLHENEHVCPLEPVSAFSAEHISPHTRVVDIYDTDVKFVKSEDC